MDYKKIAVIIVRKFGFSSANCFDVDELVSRVMISLYSADADFDAKRSKFKEDSERARYSFRLNRAIFAIKSYKRELRKNAKRKDMLKKIPVSTIYNQSPLDAIINEEHAELNTRRINFLLRNSGLTNKQSDCIRQHFFEGKTYGAIGQLYDPPVSKQDIYQIITSGLEKMKRTAGVLTCMTTND